MSNTYFQFKQFRVEQGACAMKVSTDACIQGAWTPANDTTHKILDIGAGTGLLSLMVAQRCNARIDAIEADARAAAQAEENFAASPWNARLSLVHQDVRQYVAADKYDLIICNPPFFQNSLLGDNTERNIARHTINLSYSDIASVLERMLDDNGYASIMLPLAAHEEWVSILAKIGWHIHGRLSVFPKAGSFLPNRIISLCGRNEPFEIEEQSLYIRSGDNTYTSAFKQLLRPYYLDL
ncbi:MAG: methyltransferase [Taibaiella sp.]|nr:methyltransferase [Taibaiella sp.]